MNFENSVALVTGSSRGIGSAIAHSFAEAGADIVINHRRTGASEDSARSHVERIRGLGRRAVAIRADISNDDEVKDLFCRVAEELGRLDYLVLNAARAPFKPIERLLSRDLKQLIDTNLIGNLNCMREASPLLERSGGSVVFVSSLGGRFHLPSYPLGVMKAAMEAVVRDSAETLSSRGIRVNAVCGGLARTDSLKTLRLEWPEVESLPEEVFVTGEEIADVVLFLCSPAARAVRGQTIVVDRGLGNRLYCGHSV